MHKRAAGVLVWPKANKIKPTDEWAALTPRKLPMSGCSLSRTPHRTNQSPPWTSLWRLARPRGLRRQPVI